MVGWHHWLDGHEFEQTPGDGEGQGGLACFIPWGCKELDTTIELGPLIDFIRVYTKFEIDLKNQEKIESF